MDFESWQEILIVYNTLLSLVMKLVEANGNPTVKLSDNLAKALGPKDLVEWVKQTCRYTNTFSEELVY